MQVIYICTAQQFTRFQLARPRRAVPQRQLGFLLVQFSAVQLLRRELSAAMGDVFDRLREGDVHGRETGSSRGTSGGGRSRRVAEWFDDR